MAKGAEDYLKEPYSRILIPDNNGSFSAEILEFPGCYAEGGTPDEAMQNLTDVAKSWIEASLEQGQDIPEPLMNQGYGGKIALRIPRSLHRQAVRMAERDGVSLNQFIISAIATRVGIEDFYSQILEKFNRQLASRTINVFISKPINTRAANISGSNFFPGMTIDKRASSIVEVR
jgi:predicted RNase H-like HicB family nuclease